MTRLKDNVLLLTVAVLLLTACSSDRNCFVMRGAVLATEDLKTADWPRLASEIGINTLGTHVTPDEVLAFWESDCGKKFRDDCRRRGIEVEHELHAMKTLLPRDFFGMDSTMFRMDERGRRIADYNCCASSQRALDTIAARALWYARHLTATNHRYYYWLDDGAPMCQCSSCSQYTVSEQALLIENSIIKALRTFDPKAMLAHLAYQSSMKAPEKVKPEEGIFLEFAPFIRRIDRPLTDTVCNKDGWCNADNLKYLEDNLKVFPVETAVALDYWLDVSMASGWKKPAKRLPWHSDVFRADINVYARMGIRNVTSFAVYMDSAYFKAYPSTNELKEYGDVLKNFRTAAASR